MNPTCIRSVQFFTAATPLARPIADSTHEITSIAFVITRLELASGVVGESYLLAFHYSRRAIAADLRRRSGLSLAMGEREFDTLALRELIRCGGMTSGNPTSCAWAAWSHGAPPPHWPTPTTSRCCRTTTRSTTYPSC